ncbi:MAG: hypothetical protein IV103_16870 [Zoogloea sp.]|nr:hypothetical protein [Zoogloea sp.]
MTPPSTTRWVTSKTLIFNDPVKGKEYEVPAGEPCVLVDMIKTACDRGFLDGKNEADMWAARTNVQRGYKLVWLRGLLRGLMAEDIEPARQASDAICRTKSDI